MLQGNSHISLPTVIFPTSDRKRESEETFSYFFSFFYYYFEAMSEGMKLQIGGVKLASPKTHSGIDLFPLDHAVSPLPWLLVFIPMS